ncbi:DUF2474 domain-containing protein [Sodalis sp. RH21]|uniref:DUF2474 domain-containing protein n=1 Tax=unclassified Sodalis (in: enterobacteria) TaxID=2636512 RepID=UPI0039B5180E
MATLQNTARQREMKPLWRRLLWLAVLWTASVLALGVVAALFRLMMTAAGMSSH